jgi:colicin import membrane protein
MSLKKNKNPRQDSKKKSRIMAGENRLVNRLRQAAVMVFDVENPRRTLTVFCALSFLGHLVLFALAAWAHLPGYSQHRAFQLPGAISVDLVAFNPSPPGNMAQMSAVEDSLPAESVKSAAPAYTEPESLSEPDSVAVKTAVAEKMDSSDFVVKAPEKPKTKTSLKQRTIDTAKVAKNVAQTDEKPKETPKAKPPSQPLTDRIAQLRKEVGDYSGILGREKGHEQTQARGHGGTGATSRRELQQIEVFQAEVSVRLKSNWVFSENLAGDTRGLESRLVIKIMPNGDITDVWFEKRSGNAYLDDSAYRTVMKSNPLPPLPAGYPYYHLVVGFTPSGIF